MVHLSGSGSKLTVSSPDLVAFSTARLVELGPWLNSHVLTVYADGSLYAYDVQNNALLRLAKGGTSYLRALGVVTAH